MAPVRASIRSATASACSRSMRPLTTARRLNSPGSAGRAPAATHAANTDAGTTRPPCVHSSSTSSPVYELGAGKNVASASSSCTPSTGCLSATRVATRGTSSPAPSALATARAFAPLTRSRASAPRPSAVATATIVSSPPASSNALRGEAGSASSYEFGVMSEIVDGVARRAAGNRTATATATD